ncbi:M3 family oligoendopeptidase [Candidatus Puniceispirillum sp.]|nr:M3 family oligoendopeptidase [Candidatus Puniceispirillum sp.]
MPDSCPVWSLDDLYAGVNSPALKTDMAECHRAAKQLEAEWRGRLGELTANQLIGVIKSYETILERLGKVQSHAQLLFAANTNDAAIAKHHQSVREVGAEIGAALLFVELELAKIGEGRMAVLLKASGLKHYAPWLRRVRAMASFQLSDEIEKMIAERSPTGSGAWVRLFDETMTSMRFAFQGSEVTEAEILDALSSTDPAKRTEAGHSLSTTLKDYQRLLSLVINTITKDKQIEDGWRGFDRPVSSRNLANDVDDNVVDALAEAVNGRNEDLSHRYYTLKSGWMGKKQIDWWDRNAPLPGDNDQQYSWTNAQEIVLEAFGDFDADMAEIAKPFFDKNWIDAAPRAGKSSGAFSHPVVPSAHPYILMNFAGKSRDVMTLAHEMGHGIHQVLAAEQGYLMSDTPLTLAETASVFAEMLVFRRLVDNESDANVRRLLLAGKVEDMLNTVVRQIAFHNFETQLHDRRAKAELTADEISDIWMETQRVALGPAIRIGDDYRSIWSYVPHFVHTPFYVYAYAFGDCLVNALWQKYQLAQEKKTEDIFIQNYKGLLKAGGKDRYDVALKPFDLDAGKPAFWSLGLDMISGMIDELEGLA